MAIEGPLRELGIHDVFQLLDLGRKTGMMRVTSDLRHNAGTIHFEDGAIIAAQVRSNPHPLGGLLLRTAKITSADLDQARERQMRHGDSRRLGEILVGMGVISQRELERVVRFQVEEVVFEVMSWQEGYFSFSEGPVTDVPSEAAVRIPVEAMLMEGARRIDEWSLVEKRVPHLGVVPTLAPSVAGDEGELDLLPPEWELLAGIDGQRDIRSLAALLGRSEFDVAKTVFGLESAGVVMLLDPGSVIRPRSSGHADVAELLDRAEQAMKVDDLEGARASAEEAAGIKPHDPLVHLLLGRIHLKAKRASDAVDELRRAIRLAPTLAVALRYLGYALAAQGKFVDANEAWDRWEATPELPAEERAAMEDVKKARHAVLTLEANVWGPRG
jgi:uncharacterized protein DUF4388/tetratricopeptide repeat protein